MGTDRVTKATNRTIWPSLHDGSAGLGAVSPH
jgi:hypothetical protein